MNEKTKKLAYITTNIAPFRVLLLDRLSQYFSISLLYFREIEKGTKKEYVNKRSENIDFFNLTTLKGFKRVRKVFSYDYILFDGYTGFKKILLMLFCILMRKKYFISIDGVIPKKSNFIKRKLKSFLISKAVRVFSTNKCTNNYLMLLSKKVRIKNHIFTTLCNEDIDRIRELRHEFENGGDKKKTILFIGKFVETKGIYDFLDFASENADEYNFICVGGSENELKTKYSIPSVKFINFLEKEEILKLMVSCDLFVLPTYTDVWGLVIIEALTCLIPVVTTYQCNAGCEFIKNGINGYLYNYSEKKQLGRCIRDALCLDKAVVTEMNSKIMNNYTVENAALLMAEELLK